MPTVVDFYTLLPLVEGDGTVRYPRVTSPYGPRGTGIHYGTDVGGGWRYKDFPTPVPAPSTITFVERSSTGYGNRVIYRIDSTNYQVLIAHLHTINVKVGDKLQAGQSIGGMGTTGNSTGEHWHIEIRSLPEPGRAANQTTRLGDPETWRLGLHTGRVQYIVERGDALHIIATKYGTTVQQLVAWNDIADPNKIQVGQFLWVTGPRETTYPVEPVVTVPIDRPPTYSYTEEVFHTVTKITGKLPIPSVIINNKGYISAQDVASLLNMQVKLDTETREIILLPFPKSIPGRRTGRHGGVL